MLGDLSKSAVIGGKGHGNRLFSGDIFIVSFILDSCMCFRSFFFCLALLPQFLEAHGTMEMPKSRVRRVYEAMTQQPRPAWAAQAIAADGEQSYYTWNQLSRNFITAINGDWQPYVTGIPDGQLASAGNNSATASLAGHPGLSFSGLDSTTAAWPATPVIAGVFPFRFYATAPHDPSFFHVWISKPGYQVNTPLRWVDLDYLGQPTVTKTGNFYDFPVTLPARVGRAVVYVAWQRIDLGGEVFFALCDLDYAAGYTTPSVGFATSALNVGENAATVSATVTVHPAAPAGGVSINYATSPGTATSADFTATTGTLTFAAGETSKTISIPILNDSLVESPEFFSVALSGAVGADLGQNGLQVTITDDDTPSVTSGGYRFVVTQNWGSGWEGKLELVNGGSAAWSPWSLEFDAPWAISSAYNGTVNSRVGDHYTCAPSSWNANVSPGGTVVFDWLVTNSGGLPPSAPTNVRINGQLLAQLQPAVSIQSTEVTETDADTTVTVPLSLDAAHNSPIVVAWQTVANTAVAGSDFLAASGSVTFAAGETAKTLSITLKGDTVAEAVETFSVALSAVVGQPVPVFAPNRQVATVTVRDDDAAPAVWVTGGALVEGNSGQKNLAFHVRLSRTVKAGETIRFGYQTADITAAAGLDYSTIRGFAEFAAGSDLVTLTVPVYGDLRDEELELLQLQLRQPVGAVARNTFAIGQIVDDDLAGAAVSSQRRLVAYVDATGAPVALPPAGSVTHLMAAFANVAADGSLTSVPQVAAWKTSPAVKVLLSVGGWTWSVNFPTVAADPVKRATFVQSCLQAVTSQQLDGIDLDWEWPGGGNTTPQAGDRANFTALVHELRVALGPSRELTCFAPATAANLAFWDLASLKNDFTFFNVQGYDLHGPWDAKTGHQSGLAGNPSKADELDITTVLGLYEAAGVPRAQLLVGAPFYGHFWSGVGPNQQGFDQTGNGQTSPSYATLENGWAKSFLRGWDAYAQVPFLYEQAGGRWVTYDDPQSLYAKAQFAKQEDYGGVFFWQLGGDTADRQLQTTLSDSLATLSPTDSDIDGLPDAWENFYYGNLSRTAASDSDGDGGNALFEYQARTSPTDAQDILRLAADLSFDTNAGITYTLQRSTNLTSWTNVEQLVGDGLNNHFHDTSQAKRLFYRVAVSR
jgi:predicted carbohydrate-binding protein with CBM5 and CBM33 domain/spore germination protein YaaH